jgi:hypothetical protein
MRSLINTSTILITIICETTTGREQHGPQWAPQDQAGTVVDFRTLEGSLDRGCKYMGERK